MLTGEYTHNSLNYIKHKCWTIGKMNNKPNELESKKNDLK